MDYLREEGLTNKGGGMKEYKLPKSKDKLGYSDKEIDQICKDLSIDRKVFGRALGINTVAIAKDGTSRTYQCDIERALYKLKCSGGKYHPWD